MSVYLRAPSLPFVLQVEGADVAAVSSYAKKWAESGLPLSIKLSETRAVLVNFNLVPGAIFSDQPPAGDDLEMFQISAGALLPPPSTVQ